MTTAEVARLFRVTPAQIARWTANGKLTAIKTPGGHNRYPAGQPVIAEAIAYLNGKRRHAVNAFTAIAIAWLTREGAPVAMAIVRGYNTRAAKKSEIKAAAAKGEQP